MSQQEPPAQPPPSGARSSGSNGPNGPNGPAGPTPSYTPPGGRHPRRDDSSRAAWAAGGTLFAGMMLLFAGILAVLEGAAGIAHTTVYSITSGGYAFKFNERSWGIIHLVIGVLAIIVALGVLRGLEWARWTGIGIAGLSIVAQFIFLPYQPIWSLILIAIDTFVIWSLATYHHPHHGHGSGGAV